MSGRTIWLAKDADWHQSEASVALGQDCGPVGIAVLDWLACKANARGQASASLQQIADGVFSTTNDVFGAVLAADREGICVVAGFDGDTWRFQLHPECGFRFGRKPVSSATRKLVIERDGYVCGLCGGDVEPADLHIDHVYPVALGGTNDPDNLQVAHSWCNLSKGAKAEPWT